MSAHPSVAEAWKGPISLAPLFEHPGPDPETLGAAQARWRQTFAERLYGAMPAPPDRLEVTRHAIPGEDAMRLRLEMSLGKRRFAVDCALWHPGGPDPAPLVCGLDFIGPAGVLRSAGFPLDPGARVLASPERGTPEGRLAETARGRAVDAWPVNTLLAQGYAALLSCYGSWVPDDAAVWTDHGLAPLMAFGTAPPVGAITLWAWAISRMIDAAETLPGIDMHNVTVAGHSRLGKAALWAAANDPRIATTFANSPGAAGTSPEAHAVGETLSQLARRFPHWLRPNATAPAPLDQHALLATLAPRRLYVATAEDDLWADPLGSLAALSAAVSAWPNPPDWPAPDQLWPAPQHLHAPALGWHLRQGSHDLTPEDWKHFLAFIARH